MNLQNKFFSVFTVLAWGATFLFFYMCCKSDNNSETSGDATLTKGLVAQYNAGELIDEFKAIIMLVVLMQHSRSMNSQKYLPLAAIHLL